MPAFQSKPFRPSSAQKATFGDRIAAAYRARLNKHPFLLFGLPFIAVIVSASFVLTPATALRYERHDRKSRQLNDMDRLGLGKGARRVSEFNIQEEYQVCVRSSR